ncbi:MAG TPA: hypothetical protein HPP77_03830 [Candidatus Hydrogenedentes bacterium]|nr:hypothetical protein [Candidatus Hydrogenedentota bacterium]
MHMFIIVSATGAAGFLASFVMLKAGVGSMCVRYPLAVGIAYLVFLALLRIWLSGCAMFDDSQVGPVDALQAVDALADASHAAASDVPSVEAGGATGGEALGALDMDEFLFIVIAVAALCAGFLVCLYVVWTAPALLAEVLVDGIVMCRVYKRLRINAQSYWLFGALRRTWFPVFLVALFFALAGFAMQQIVQDAKSIGPVISYIADKVR